MERRKEVEPIKDEEMIDLEALQKTKQEKFLEKHPPIPDEEIPRKMADREAAKDKRTRDIQKIEENLTTFFEKDFPLINPETNKVLCWVKDVQYFKLLEMIPEEMLEDMGSDEDINIVEVIIKLREYKDHTFKIMEEVITIPDHNWEWWRDNSNQTFLDLFNDYLEKRISKISSDVSFF